ncbi:endonuclease/exonuclease/phosphatase family protein [Arthrobacter sp. KBS0703]|jgi:endonuclease/exonuclease/phosphatase family metal-dependent hydrolase|uniref:endonuclease/exonuclease/phosphatase family protein n=1 Tax=Bacteria TaxID=2 RepID=UPI00098F8228|nr:endonuclease/exonuclease/phosphatase family protein [Arthrobacter sp. KBS0703]TSE15516.1 endonuclease/exonuclease/phosphatase family protein [Arthrobacter sp. KBS0703]
MRVISYNLRKHKASGELVSLARNFGIDALCLQECDSAELPDTLGPLQLADFTKGNRLGLAIYYRSDRFTALETKTFALHKSMHDRVMAPAHERLIGTRMVDNATDHELVIGSFHAAPLTASNSLRRKQIHAAHAELLSMGEGLMTLMVGDFNYPFFTKNLHARMKDSGYALSLSDRRTYTRYKVFKGHFDFATSLGLDIESVETLPRGKSDHLPILITAEYGQDRAPIKAAQPVS